MTFVVGSGLRLAVNSLNEATFQENEFRIEPELGNTPRIIRFDDGSIFETTEHQKFKAFEKQLKGKNLPSIISFLESSWRTALLSVAAVAIFCILFFLYGIPAIAASVAEVVPQSMRVKMSNESMDIMHASKLLGSTSLTSTRQEELKELFFNALAESGFAEASQYDYKLSFRSSTALGKNAFALPSGEVVFTDDLIEACTDEEILAVMLHEIAHVELQHGIRSVIQNAGLLVIISLAIGDANGVSSLVSALPTLLAESHYSQKFEIEADSFSCQYLEKLGYRTTALAGALKSIHEGVPDMPLEDILSTHPSLKARLDNIEKRTTLSWE